MSFSSTGKEWLCMWCSGATHSAPYKSVGKIRDMTPETGGSILSETDSGDRTPYKKQGSVKPSIRITFDVQRTNYITRNFIVDENGDVPWHSLVFYDGKTWWYADYAKGNTARLRTSPGEMLQCEAVVAVSGVIQTTTKTYSGLTENPLTHEDVSTFSVDGSGWGNWSRLEWGVNNNVQQVSLGTAIQPSEIFEQQADHAGEYRISKKWSASKFDESQGGDYVPIVVAVTDKQTTPVTTTFTYESGIVRNASIENRDLDLVYEVGSWEAIDVDVARS